jgi:hypothetical protein
MPPFGFFPFLICGFGTSEIVARRKKLRLWGTKLNILAAIF